MKRVKDSNGLQSEAKIRYEIKQKSKSFTPLDVQLDAEKLAILKAVTGIDDSKEALNEVIHDALDRFVKLSLINQLVENDAEMDMRKSQ